MPPPNTFVTADLHFDHAAILKHTGRPFRDLDDMNRSLVEKWNDLVHKRDLVYILGDFAFKNHAHWLDQLNGKKILILGNHDEMSQKCLEKFREVHESHFCKINGVWVYLNHYACLTWQNCHYGTYHLFAHSHDRIETMNLSMDVGVDTPLANYAPIPWENIVKQMDIRTKKMKRAGRVDENKSGVNVFFRQNDLDYLRHGKWLVKFFHQDSGGEVKIHTTEIKWDPFICIISLMRKFFQKRKTK